MEIKLNEKLHSQVLLSLHQRKWVRLNKEVQNAFQKPPLRVDPDSFAPVGAFKDGDHLGPHHMVIQELEVFLSVHKLVDIRMRNFLAQLWLCFQESLVSFVCDVDHMFMQTFRDD